MLECEIKASFLNRKSKPSTLYEYTKKHYEKQQQIQKLLQNTIVKHFVEGKSNETNYKNSLNFYLTKCLDRLQETFDKHEYLIEYSWYYDGKNNQIAKIFNKACDTIYQQYEQWKDNKILYEILEEEERKKQAKKNKQKKKQKNKQKQKKQNKKCQENEQGFKKQQQTEQLRKQELNKQIHIKQKELANKCELKKQEKFEAEQNNQHKQKQVKTKKKNKKGKKNESKKQKQQTGIQSLADKIEQNKNIINGRINEYYQQYVDGLAQRAAHLERYRKLVFQTVQSFVELDIIGKFQIQWKLCLYGSTAAQFALRKSDIDLVLLVDTDKLTLKDIYEILRLKNWAIQTKVINAQIPLINFRVSLSYSEIARAQLQPKHLKKIQNYTFKVDLTLSQIDNIHSGIENTKYLIELFHQSPPLKTICLLFKQYFRVKKLNKPYTGGISSYVLVILIYSILSSMGALKHDKPDICSQIKLISHYMVKLFSPFKTVVSCDSKDAIKPDPNLHLNIQHPETRKLIKTSAFNIEEIITEFEKFGMFQCLIDEQLLKIPIQETKNMKKTFFRQLQNFLPSVEEEMQKQ